MYSDIDVLKVVFFLIFAAKHLFTDRKTLDLNQTDATCFIKQ